MIQTPDARRARPGFTLVELLVSAAICVIIMTVLAVCFQSGLEAIRQMRSQGDMTDQLRAVGEMMKRDLTVDHFLTVETGDQQNQNPIFPGRRLSNYDFVNWGFQ